MRRIFLIISISFSVLSLFSCATAVKINVALSSVDVSENSASNIHNFEADNILSYKDNIISATWDTDTSPILLTDNIAQRVPPISLERVPGVAHQ